MEQGKQVKGRMGGGGGGDRAVQPQHVQQQQARVQAPTTLVTACVLAPVALMTHFESKLLSKAAWTTQEGTRDDWCLLTTMTLSFSALSFWTVFLAERA